MAKLKEDDEKQQSKSAEFREHKIDMLAKAGEIGYGGERAPDEDEFANLLADIFVLLVDVKAPEELYQVLRDNELRVKKKKRPLCEFEI